MSNMSVLDIFVLKKKKKKIGLSIYSERSGETVISQ